MSRSQIEILPTDLARTLTSYLPLNEVKNLTSTSKSGYSIFQPIANELIALYAVAHGAEATLINLTKRTIEK
jgi:hypothetical protein